MNQWPRYRQMAQFYGPPAKVPQKMLYLPYKMVLAWDPGVTVKRFSIHARCHDSALHCFEQIAKHYSPEEIIEHGFDKFGGCYNPRRMRGGRSWSTHAWAAAIDVDPARNRFRWGYDAEADKHDAWGSNGKPYLARPECVKFWEIWEAEGWVSLGRKRNFDWMHVQAARL